MTTARIDWEALARRLGTLRDGGETPGAHRVAIPQILRRTHGEHIVHRGPGGLDLDQRAHQIRPGIGGQPPHGARL